MLKINISSIHSAEGRKHLEDALPVLRRMDDTKAVDALVDLYDLGTQAGVESAEDVIHELGGWIAKIVAAHVKNDAARLNAVLNEFIEARCVVKGGPAPSYTPNTTH